jgi:hypothetical protein
MPHKNISSGQLKRLHILWKQYSSRNLDFHPDQRLLWASQQVKRTLTSFRQLTLAEASDLINILQGSMGIAETSPSRGVRKYRSRIKDSSQARAAGTEGRRGSRRTVTIATAEDLAMIQAQLNQMQWTRERLQAFLESPSSALGKRTSTELRTLADVNRVLWALKRIDRSQRRETA